MAMVGAGVSVRNRVGKFLRLSVEIPGKTSGGMSRECQGNCLRDMYEWKCPRGTSGECSGNFRGNVRGRDRTDVRGMSRVNVRGISGGNVRGKGTFGGNVRKMFGLGIFWGNVR